MHKNLASYNPILLILDFLNSKIDLPFLLNFNLQALSLLLSSSSWLAYYSIVYLQLLALPTERFLSNTDKEALFLLLPSQLPDASCADDLLHPFHLLLDAL